MDGGFIRDDSESDVDEIGEVASDEENDRIVDDSVIVDEIGEVASDEENDRIEDDSVIPLEGLWAETLHPRYVY